MQSQNSRFTDLDLEVEEDYEEAGLTEAGDDDSELDLEEEDVDSEPDIDLDIDLDEEDGDDDDLDEDDGYEDKVHWYEALGAVSPMHAFYIAVGRYHASFEVR